MHWINWLIVVVYLVWVVVDGIRKSKDTDTVSGYFLANKSLSWWVVGLSVMATQLSAVTMIGTPGQGATDGMRFIQLYLGLPLAMVILGVTIVPLLHGSGVYTAYEYLERRFDARTRSLTAFLFLISRGLSAGAIMAAPGVVFSAVFGIPLVWAVALIGLPTVIYTMIGGVQAVAWADVKQMVLIVVALVAIMICSIVLGMGLPSAVCYLLMATLIGPVLNKLGVIPLAAHLFIFYFGMMSMVTPPVALAAFASASIAKANIMATGLAAFRFSLVGFTLPFMFVYRPQLLLLSETEGGLTFLSIVFAVLAATLGIIALAAAIAGFLFTPLAWRWRIALFAAAALLPYPDPPVEIGPISIAIFDTLGAVILIATAFLDWKAGTRSSGQEGPSELAP